MAQRTTAMEEATVLKVDSEVQGFEGIKAVDGDPNTFWHTPWAGDMPGYPHTLDIDLGSEVEIKGYSLQPRMDGLTGGESIGLGQSGRKALGPRDQLERVSERSSRETGHVPRAIAGQVRPAHRA